MADPDTVLLHRRQTVYVEAAADTTPHATTATTATTALPTAVPLREGITALEAELIGRGHVLSEPLRQALAELPPEALAPQGRRLLARIDGLLGADRSHIPLFRGFPDSVPEGALSVYLAGILQYVRWTPEQPCGTCGEHRPVRLLAPSGRLVCEYCWDAAPEIAPLAPGAEALFRALAAEAESLIAAAPPRPVPAAGPVLRMLTLGTHWHADLLAEVHGLLARRTPLNPQDRTDLDVLLEYCLQDEELGWLPESIPLRTTRAAVLGRVLADRDLAEAVRPRLPALLGTATDVLRTLAALGGEQPDLTVFPKLRGVLPRRLRRDLLAALDALHPPAAAEDMLRYPAFWKRAGEALHPYEQHRRFPRAALAFAVVRGTDLRRDTRLGEALTAAAGEYPELRLAEGRLRVRTFDSRVEAALSARDTAAAVALLRQRPGVLLRRLDHLLRTAPVVVPGPVLPEGLDGALREGLPKAGPGPLLGALGALRGRGDEEPGARPLAATVPEPAAVRVGVGSGAAARVTTQGAAPSRKLKITRTPIAPKPRRAEPRRRRPAPEPGAESAPRRVFFPSGRITRAVAVPDLRPSIRQDAADSALRLFEQEVLRRLGALPGHQIAVLDAGLADLPVPTAERASARALVQVPRGSVQRLPSGPVLRLFLHWMEQEGGSEDERVDLDLSVAFLDAKFARVGHCDYTRLVFGRRAAVHSGDYTAAPPPEGATEFVDLQVSRLLAAGVRYAVVAVFSFNDVPFEELADAFAGFAALPAGQEGAGALHSANGRRAADSTGPAFDPAAVRQRFDLAGDSRTLLPMVLDLRHRTLQWTDIHLASESGDFHSLWTHGRRLSRLAEDLAGAFDNRVTLWDLARWHAAARCPEVLVHGTLTGRPALLRRGRDEAAVDFAERIRRAAGSNRAEAESVSEGTELLAPTPDPVPALLADRDVFVAQLAAEYGTSAASGEMYRLYPGPADASPLLRRTAADLVGALAPKE